MRLAPFGVPGCQECAGETGWVQIRGLQIAEGLANEWVSVEGAAIRFETFFREELVGLNQTDLQVGPLRVN